jgi:hypothetical protein
LINPKGNVTKKWKFGCISPKFKEAVKTRSKYQLMNSLYKSSILRHELNNITYRERIKSEQGRV